MIDTLAKIGGLFVLATFWHFVADWVPQSHQEAIAKARNADTRAWHCFKYTFIFLAPLIGMGALGNSVIAITCAAILWVSHFVIDTYIPVMLWAKYFRKDPNFARFHEVGFTTLDPDEEAFKAMASSNIGMILIITMDQLFHIAFLLPVVTLIALYGI